MKDEPEYHEFLTNLTRLFTLTLISEKPRHGYELMQELEKNLGKKPSPGLIYPLLQRLEELGYVTPEFVEEGHERKMYTITADGKELCDKLVKRVVNIISTSFEQSVSVCVNCGCKIIDGGHTEIINEKEMVFCCSHCAAAYKAT